MDLLKKKKQELVDIILRKDDVEKNLRDELDTTKKMIMREKEELAEQYKTLYKEKKSIEDRYKSACNDCLETQHELFVQQKANKKLKVIVLVSIIVAVAAIAVAIVF